MAYTFKHYLYFLQIIHYFISLTLSLDTTHNIITTSSWWTVHDDNVINIFESWVVKHQKNYKGFSEKENKFEIFKDNLKFIEDFNSDESGAYKLGLNKFADLTYHEFKSAYLGAKPLNVDGMDQSVKDPRQCENDEKALQKAVANHPVRVVIEACGRDFQLYKSGIFPTESNGSTLDLHVVAVGYDTTEDGKDYWILKNSWGSEWGENGYIRTDRNIGSETGRCGNIAVEASYLITPNRNPQNHRSSPQSHSSESEIACDSYSSCPSQSTCCCTHIYGPYCFAWGCCPHKSAVCCDDHSRCCPQDHPICNTSSGTCSASKNRLLRIKALNRTHAEVLAKYGSL